MQIPFHRPYIGDEEINEVVATIRSGWLTTGPRTELFERNFAGYIGCRHAVAVSSCTAALHLALKAVGIRPGDEVIVPSVTFPSSAEVVCYCGARPVLVDVERGTHNIDPGVMERAISGKTRAIIPVHYGGQACDMDEIMAIAGEHKLSVVEDAAHALPAFYKGRMIGARGNLTCFSFYATKTLTAGEGGMVTTENAEWAERVRLLSFHGMSGDPWKRQNEGGSWFYEVDDLGYKYNMTDIHAAVGLAQLKKINRMWERRNEIADKYTEAFCSLEEITIPTVKSDRETSWHLYVIKLNLELLAIDRARFIEELKLKGIGTSVHFIPLHRHPFYRDTFGYRTEDFPVAEWIYERSVSLPIYPGMADEEVDYVIEAVIDTVKRFRR